VVVPSPQSYDEAGRVLHRLRSRSREVRRASLVNDVLIALTARSLGATVVTRDASDFEVIRSVCDFSLELIG
jgi:predicted nucleic acid-binding protein